MERAADDVRASFDLGSGRLFKAVLFLLGGGSRPYLFLAAHHLVIDGVSWRILLDDLDAAYRHAGRREEVEIRSQTTSFPDMAMQAGGHRAGGGVEPADG